MKPSLLRHGMNLWPPFLFTGIHVTEISPDWRRVRVELRARPWNRNFVGTHFGGSLFAMTDPFRMIPMLHCLGRDYIVWDKAGEIDFVKPGRGTVHATFELDDTVLDELRDGREDVRVADKMVERAKTSGARLLQRLRGLEAMDGVGHVRALGLMGGVELVADPAVQRTGHRITAEGGFGRMTIQLENNPLATNPKSSELTALSLVRLIEQQSRPLTI